MSNASLKDQLQAVASQLSDTLVKEHRHKHKIQRVEKRAPEKSSKLKPRWLDYVQYGVELLKTYFPTAFRSLNEVKPLKKGIKQDLVRRLSTLSEIVTEDKACMVKSLSYYVNTAAYHKTVIEGAIRIDLDGNEVGAVTAEEARYSVERQHAKQQAKLAAKPQIQTPKAPLNKTT